MSGLELYQHINIAIRPKVASQRRAKEGKFANPVAFAELGNLVARELDIALLIHIRAMIVRLCIGINRPSAAEIRGVNHGLSAQSDQEVDGVAPARLLRVKGLTPSTPDPVNPV